MINLLNHDVFLFFLNAGRNLGFFIGECQPPQNLKMMINNEINNKEIFEYLSQKKREGLKLVIVVIPDKKFHRKYS